MNRKKQCNSPSYQSLEERRLLAPVAYSNDGNLGVSGNADGVVEIVATGEETFSVTDNGNHIGTFDGIEGNIRVSLDQDSSPQDDSVRIDLVDQVVENVMVDLGNGDNDFWIDSARWNGRNSIQRVLYYGGSGNDIVDSFAVTDLLYAKMGHGEDILTAHDRGEKINFNGGQGGDQLITGEDAFFAEAFAVMGPGDDVIDFHGKQYEPFIRAGSGNDVVNFHTGSASTTSFIHLGSGDNTFNQFGFVGSDLRVRGGSGNDTVNMREDSYVSGDTAMLLGHGNNTFNLDGLFGQTQKRVFLRAEGGNDEVNLAETLEIRGSVRTVLGDGDNSFYNEGFVGTDLVAISRNEFDTFSNEGDVDGRLDLAPGRQK